MSAAVDPPATHDDATIEAPVMPESVDKKAPSPPRLDVAAKGASTPNDSSAQLSPTANDRVFPIRSAISVDPTPTPRGQFQSGGDYFQSRYDVRTSSEARRQSQSSTASQSSHASQRAPRHNAAPPKGEQAPMSRRGSLGAAHKSDASRVGSAQLSSQLFDDLAAVEAFSLCHCRGR